LHVLDINDNDLSECGKEIGNIIKAGIGMLNINKARLKNNDIEQILLHSYALTSVKLKVILAGGNSFSEEYKEHLKSLLIINAPNARIEFPENPNTILKEENSERDVGTKDKGFSGAKGLYAAIGFGYFKHLINTKTVESFINLYYLF